MPSFSFTAPIITPEEELMERDELDEVACQSIREDIFGCRWRSDDDGGCPEQAFSEHAFQQALENLPTKDTNELFEAMKIAPHLVATESAPLTSSRCDPTHEGAAKRVAQYWKHRLKLFGISRAYLPMRLDGAMMEDVGTLQKGFFSVLPCDRAGRAVIFFDRIRAIPAVASKDAVCRALFYILQKVTNEEHVQRNGFVFMENISGYDLYTHFDRILTKTQMSLLRDCFPSLLRSYHVCAGNSGKWAVELIMPVLKQIAGKYIRLRTVCHTGGTNEALSNMDSRYNLDPKQQSVIIGGAFTYGHQLLWISEQRRKESAETCTTTTLSAAAAAAHLKSGAPTSSSSVDHLFKLPTTNTNSPVVVVPMTSRVSPIRSPSRRSTLSMPLPLCGGGGGSGNSPIKSGDHVWVRLTPSQTPDRDARRSSSMSYASSTGHQATHVGRSVVKRTCAA